MAKRTMKTGQSISSINCAPADKWDDPFPLRSMVLPDQRKDLMKDMGKLQTFLLANPSFLKTKGKWL